MEIDTHQHGEAFRHMRYGTKDGRIVRSIWNSRDGVTPFIVRDPETGEELTHLPPWSADVYDPTYQPQPGDLVFIDLHPEKALMLAMRKVEHFWDDEQYPLRERGWSKEEAARMFFDSMMFFTHPETGEKVPNNTPDLIAWEAPRLP